VVELQHGADDAGAARMVPCGSSAGESSATTSLLSGSAAFPGLAAAGAAAAGLGASWYTLGLAMLGSATVSASPAPRCATACAYSVRMTASNPASGFRETARDMYTPASVGTKRSTASWSAGMPDWKAP
jgi:hypothetical protein